MSYNRKSSLDRYKFLIVGNIHIGDNVLIAPNTYVNVDVPSNSIVIGNPAIIHKNENATKEYITNIV